ncbi:MAG: hypothetical protein GC156_13115 [Actinomycetales bacterium]|nr:hypothetical protein [Actinomycetales bacterium]
MESVFDTVAGLPLHPLVVHAVVVLIPLTAVGAIVMVLRRSFSRRYGALVVGLAAVGAVSAVIAKESGERLAARVGTPTEHADLGSVLPLFAGGYVALLLAFWLVDRGIPANRPRPGWVIALGVALILAAVAATGWTVWTGHSGAVATWGSRLPA